MDKIAEQQRRILGAIAYAAGALDGSGAGVAAREVTRRVGGEDGISAPDDAERDRLAREAELAPNIRLSCQIRAMAGNWLVLGTRPELHPPLEPADDLAVGQVSGDLFAGAQRRGPLRGPGNQPLTDADARKAFWSHVVASGCAGPARGQEPSDVGPDSARRARA